MKTVIEVGANHGQDTQRFLSEGNRVFAFEPTPELHLHLKNQFKGYDNYYPIAMAVDLTNGWSWFNIAGQADWGCSSIYDFNPNINNEWQGRKDFKVTDRCRVQTIRLDTFMTIYQVDHVDYLWIDAQGNDFRVLQSLGENISNVTAGRCESALDVSLYTGTDNTTESIKVWLERRGFNTEVAPHCHHKEADIHFTNREYR